VKPVMLNALPLIILARAGYLLGHANISTTRIYDRHDRSQKIHQRLKSAIIECACSNRIRDSRPHKRAQAHLSHLLRPNHQFQMFAVERHFPSIFLSSLIR
jgi:hypothetical protein